MSDLSDRLHTAPFVRLLVPFIAGIVLGDLFRPEFKWLFLGLSISFFLLLPYFITVTFKRESLFGIILIPVFLFLGLFIATDLRYVPQPLPEKGYFAVVDEYPIEKEKSYRAVIRLLEPKIKVLAYFEKSDSLSLVEPGFAVWFHGRPEQLRKTGNPFEFDYQAYAIRNQIGHRIFIKHKDYHFLAGQKRPNLAEESLIVRDRLIKIIEDCGLKGEILHLVSSVSLGAREELEPEITQSFSKTGVTHVLAVSGMNVAIIFVVLEFFLRFLNRKKWGIIIQTLLILAGVWGYAFVTGLSASVLRAAAMFTFILIGKTLSRNANIYNSLAASAFVLLCFNPSLVYDVGFQLSYAAVFSIVYFHPFLYRLRYFKYWVPDQIWIMITVSLAAQIGTIPFLLHYFHQFPTWFLLANLMVIPLVTVILYLSCIVFAVAPIVPFLGVIMTKVLEWAGQGMLFSVRFVEKLPYSVIEGIYPSDFNLFLIVIFAVLLTVFLLYKIRIALFGSLISVIILLLLSNLNTYKKLAQREIVVFNLPGKLLVAFTHGRETIWLTSDKNGTAEKLKPYTKPYEGFRGIHRSKIICLTDSALVVFGSFAHNQNFVNFKGIAIYLPVERKRNSSDLKNLPHSDLVILSGKNKAELPLFKEKFPDAVLVENRTSGNDFEKRDNPIIASNEPKYFNTTIGGAVRINLGSASDRICKIQRCGYFSSE
ncbi:MAG: ComEC/Rec2 family competence protein [Mariniphaga sp.]